MLLSRFSLLSAVALSVGLTGFGLLGCGGQSNAEAIGKNSAAQLGSPDVPNAADTQCNIFLRDVAEAHNHGSLVTNCQGSAGSQDCWVVFNGDLDISNEALLEEDQPYVIYQSGTDPTWYQVSTTPSTGAGTGFARYTFSLTQNTALQGRPLSTIQLIPYLITTAGTHLFDHNVYANQNYILNSANNWNITYNGSYCNEPTPPGTGTVTFNAG
jgi:hypothetical protein